ncbi:LysR substrate-binding domain-containing protein [Desulfobaculum bizertense]|uniref:LysR substrate-binding domain-containing protein n=1 Tax=Desulfobaculum bizertense TaxID=376490 RepID=UPI001F2B68A7|nr:LysR substrate-binding domain-containing protein [Desulfobaculum bizertense]UIJ36866.1 LysR substrate-binding domain-containing protein [Desulfobaculum bizertense]
MELRHIRYFLMVAEELHFGRAAKRLNMSQPPLSQQIRQLEDELGVALFERTSRSVRLTDAGRAYQEDARRLLLEFKVAARRARNIQNGIEGTLRISAVARAFASGYPLAVKEFRSLYPHVSLTLKEMGSFWQLSALRKNRLDIACVGFFGDPPDGFEHMLLDGRELETLVMLPEDHRLAQRDVITLQDLDGEPMIGFPQEQHPELNAVLWNAFHAAGVEPVLVQDADRLQTELALVACGLGFSIRFSLPSYLRPRGIVFRNLSPRLPSPKLWVAWRKKEKNPVVHRFLDVLKTFRESLS